MRADERVQITSRLKRCKGKVLPGDWLVLSNRYHVVVKTADGRTWVYPAVTVNVRRLR